MVGSEARCKKGSSVHIMKGGMGELFNPAIITQL